MMTEAVSRHYKYNIETLRRLADNLEELCKALETQGEDVIEVVSEIPKRLTAYTKKTNVTIKELTLILNRTPQTSKEHLIEDIRAELVRSKRVIPKKKTVFWYRR